MQGERALEYRFVLDRATGEGVLRRAAAHLAPDVRAPERPVTYCRTLYLDSEDGLFLRSFTGGATACRIRLRQYAAASDRTGEATVSGDAAFLEIKRSCGLEREKLRIAIAHDQLDGFLAGLAERKLRPCLLTWYRRWSLGRAPLRMTLDEGIAYCLPEPPAAGAARAEPRAVIARDALAVLEVKMTGPVPGWLEKDMEALGRHLALAHSKFRVGMDALRHAQPATHRNNREFRKVG